MPSFTDTTNHKAKNRKPDSGTAHIKYKDTTCLQHRNQIIIYSDELAILQRRCNELKELIRIERAAYEKHQHALAMAQIKVKQLPATGPTRTRVVDKEKIAQRKLVAMLNGYTPEQREALMKKLGL